MPRSRIPLAAAIAAVVLAAAPAASQPSGGRPAGTTVPPALVKEVAADHERPADEVGPNLVLRRRDLDGDGRDEYLLRATGGVCSPTGNCAFYVYRREPGGGYTRLHRGGGTGFRVLPERAGRWPHLREEAHFSAAQTIRTTYAFSGGRYHWTRQEVVNGDSAPRAVTARLERSPPGREPRRAALSGATTSEARIRVSAGYTACPAARQTPGPLCGRPVLAVTWTSRTAPTPAERALWTAWRQEGVCFGYAHANGLPGGERSGRLCAADTRAEELPGGGARVRVEVHPSPELWEELRDAFRVELRGPGATFSLSEDALFGLHSFLDEVRKLNRGPGTEGG